MTREELARIASRYNTVMSRAMLKALGIEPKKSKHETRARVDRYKGIKKCFNQKHGVKM